MAYLSDKRKKYYLEMFKEYKAKYGAYYEKDAIDYIEKNMFGLDFESDLIVDIINQVFELMGVNSELEHNIYKDFLEEMQKYYDIDKDLLEVSSGMVPAFALSLRKLQERGSITVMDPDTINYEHFDGITVRREEFNMFTDVKGFDMLYAIEPCAATMDIIKKANINDKDMIMMMCGCIHGMNYSIFDIDNSRREYVEMLSSLAKNTLPEGRNVDIYTKSYLPYPVIRTYKR